MKKIFLVPLLLVSTMASALTPPISQADCQGQYLDLFSNDEINITLAFGYDDNDQKTTMDQNHLQVMTREIMKACKTWDQKICGFKRDPQNPSLFKRSIIGPDGRPKTLKITSMAPSISTSDNANRLNPLQPAQSAKVKKLFLNGLKESEITIYMGHSRDGGGPSFDPPKRNSSGDVDYDWYHRNKTDMYDMLNALKVNPHKPRIVGLFSCSSIRWFSRHINEAAPASGIIASTEAYYTADFLEVIPFLEKIFSYQCLDKFSLSDGKNVSRLKQDKSWKKPTQSMPKSQLTKLTLENLASYLSSEDPQIRAWAYLEIKSYSSGLYTPYVHRELVNFRISNSGRR